MTIFQYIQKIFSGKSFGTIFEIGAYRCDDTPSIILNSGLKQGNFQYYAFEPDPRNIPHILNKEISKYINLIPVAIGPENGNVTLYQSSGNINPAGESWTGSSSIRKPKNHLDAFPWCKFDSAVQVPVLTLDDFVKVNRIDGIDFIWCDIQGAEADMVKGGQNALKSTEYLYCEYSDHEMYDGQMKLDDWIGLLPGKWEIIEKFAHDVLLKNDSYVSQK